jgi:hypothetical protein
MPGVVVTLPLPASRRLMLARTRGAFRWAVWHEPEAGPVDGGERPGGAGVREPRRPVPPHLGGSVALPFDR